MFLVIKYIPFGKIVEFLVIESIDILSIFCYIQECEPLC